MFKSKEFSLCKQDLRVYTDNIFVFILEAPSLCEQVLCVYTRNTGSKIGDG